MGYIQNFEDRKYRSYRASIDPILIPALVSILSIFGVILFLIISAKTEDHDLHEGKIYRQAVALDFDIFSVGE